MHRSDADLVSESFAGFLSEYQDAGLGELTVGETVAIVSRISVARQKLAYVQRARFASFHVPGMGQFMTGDTGAGVAYLLAGLTTGVGSLVGWYLLLPEDLQFGSLDYLNEPFSDIEDAWKGHSLSDYLPSIGVMAGGMLVNGIVRVLSAGAAGKSARRNIRDETVQFEARPFLFLSGPHGPGMGMRMRMRFK
jgi:TM2 domain-containing membrane protein YozV